jgi:hypothetical protein
MSALSDKYMRGIPMKPYDMIREGLFILAGVAIVVILLSAVWGFPRIPPLTLKQVAITAPVAFTERTLSYFDGQSGLQTYGPPYTGDRENAQRVGPICPACWTGVAHPTDFRQALVINPLKSAAVLNPDIATALDSYDKATPAQQKAWTDAYGAALGKATAKDSKLILATGDYGPVPTLMNGMLKLAQAGLLEGALVQGANPNYAPYNTDFTLPLYYLGGDRIMGTVADHFDEQGGQWGMSHVAGPYPGAWWLWPYAFLYQIPAIGNADAADLIAGMIIAAFGLILFFLPFVPGLNRLPYIIPVYRLIWRDWYAKYPSGDPTRDPANSGFDSDRGQFPSTKPG